MTNRHTEHGTVTWIAIKAKSLDIGSSVSVEAYSGV